MTTLYDSDYFAWTREQADALERRSANEIDWENLREEIDDLGKSRRRELEGRLRVLIAHLLKWRMQPDRQGTSWLFTIREQRRAIVEVLDENPSLKPATDEAVRRAWPKAVDDAVLETRYPASDFPGAPIFDFDHAMTTPVELNERSIELEGHRLSKARQYER